MQRRFSSTMEMLDGFLADEGRSRDQLRIAVDVGTDLQHRRFAVATRECREVGLGHHQGYLYRMPGGAFDTERHLHFLREGRYVEMMKDDVVHVATVVKKRAG